MFKVYRYENPNDRLGPYTCDMRGIDDSVIFEMARKHATSDKHPSVRVDGLDFIQDAKENSFLCACETLKGLKNWFKGYNKKLIEGGFVLVEYTVAHYIIGNSGLQCVFHINNVVNRKVLPLF